MEYHSAIVDETGDVVEWCENLTQEEINKELELHSEYSIQCVLT